MTGKGPVEEGRSSGSCKCFTCWCGCQLPGCSLHDAIHFFSDLFSDCTIRHGFNTRDFLKEKESLRILRLASGASGFQIKRRARSAAVMPNKAANPAETHRLSDTHRVSRGDGSLS